MSILDMTALELGKRIQSGDITAVQAAEASLARIKAVEPSIHAYVTVNEEKTMEQAGKVQAEIEAGSLADLWPEYLWLSRTTCVRKECGPPAVPEYWKTLSPPTRPRQLPIWSRQEPLSWERPTWMNSPWEAPRRHPPLALPGIHGTRNMRRGDPPAVPARRWLPGSAFMPWGLIQAVPYASPAPSAASRASSPPTGPCPDMGLLPMVHPWTR